MKSINTHAMHASCAEPFIMPDAGAQSSITTVHVYGSSRDGFGDEQGMRGGGWYEGEDVIAIPGRSS